MATGDVLRFNLDTMSGVFPGVKPRHFFRFRISNCIRTSESQPESQPRWVAAIWLEEPEAWVVIDEQGNETCRVAGSYDVITIDQLIESLRSLGHEPHCCGTCTFWKVDRAQNEKVRSGTCALENGHCGISLPWDADISMLKRVDSQTAPSLACEYWIHQCTPLELGNPTAKVTSTQNGNDARSVAKDPILDKEGSTGAGLVERVKKRLVRPFTRLVKSRNNGALESATTSRFELEQSGYSAGTEPCLTCHGRMANMASITAESTSGDTQTYSLWRCRVCNATYLNSWVDRWARLDNLETEEKIYRLSPLEFATIYGQISPANNLSTAGEPQSQPSPHEWLREYASSRVPLSHQIRHGR